MEKKIIKIENSGERLDFFLINVFEDYSRAKIQKMIKNKEVLVNGREEKPSYKIKEGDIITLEEKEEIFKLKPQNIPLDIRYEDDELIVLNKPKNMLTHPTVNEIEGTLVNALLFHTKGNLSDIGGEERRGIVHRLDRDTTGLMLAAKTNFSHVELQKQIKEKTAIRKYLAICYGEIKDDFGTINKPISRTLGETVKMKIADINDKNAKEAITHFKVLERFEGATLLELQLETGRTHQIRLHLSSIGHGVLGDKLYAKGFHHKFLDKIKLQGQVLQSYYLSFTHPKLNEIIELKLNENELDSDFRRVLKILRENKK